tara:strand:+ start:224 stop:586 length:363 start_codon:yes stop_codon:yes gene_type:complete
MILSLLSVACFTLPMSAFAGDDDNTTEALQNKVIKLLSAQENNDKQFDNAYKEIKKVGAKLPKLNDSFQAQLKKLQKNNNKLIKEVKQANEEQIAALTKQLNELKKRLSTKPQKSSSVVQ